MIYSVFPDGMDEVGRYSLLLLRERRFRVVGVWAVAAASVALAAVVGRADAGPSATLECADEDMVITAIAETDDDAEGYSSPGAALRAFMANQFEELDAGSVQETGRGPERASYAISVGAQKKFLADVEKLKMGPGWAPAGAHVCASFLYDQKEGDQ